MYFSVFWVSYCLEMIGVIVRGMVPTSNSDGRNNLRLDLFNANIANLVLYKKLELLAE